MIRQDSRFAWIQVLIAFILMMVTPGLNTQMKAQQNIDRCIFNCADTECGEDIVLASAGTIIDLDHGTSEPLIEGEIEQAIFNHINQTLINCCNIRIADLTNLTEPETGSSFNYT